MNFPEAEAYLLSLGNEIETMKLGLENITALLAGMDDPHTRYKKVQVAGTNGKGSVCAFLDSICRSADIRTGLYTSPHLISITERIRIDGVDISEDEFARLASVVREKSESLSADGLLTYRPTFFEQVTAIALIAFAEAKVELAILETGLGGRYDAVTAARAEIAAITRIDLDHQEYLGDTIEEIAAEKAAIIREDSRVVLLHQSRSVEQVLVGRCREVGVEPTWATREVRIIRERELAPWLQATFVTEKAAYSNILFLGMLGEHQIENAAIAIAIAEKLHLVSLDLKHDSFIPGLENTKHPGRLERNGEFLLDGAHNPAGAKALLAYLDEFVGSPVALIFGAMGDKAVDEIAEIIWPRAEKIILTRPSNSRAMSADELAAFAPEGVDPGRIVKTVSVAEAMKRAKEITPADGLIVVTGSLYLVGEVKKLLNN